MWKRIYGGLTLKIEKQLQDDHQMRLIVEVEAERMEASKRRAARKLAERGKIPGFRPGKAPYEIVRRHYGDEALYEQAVDMLVDELYPEVLKQAEVEPAAAGSLEDVEGNEAPKFTFLVPLAPSVTLGDYRSLRLPYEWSAPGKERVDEALEELRLMYATTETVERPLRMGDYAVVNVKADEEDHELSREGATVYVGKRDADDVWPYPGFARALIGLKPGESRSLKHKFSRDHLVKALRGRTITFAATVVSVRGVTLPPLDDEFAGMVSSAETLEQLRVVLQNVLEARSKEDYDDEYFVKLVDALREGATIKYPPQVLEHEVEHVLDELRQRLAAQGVELEAYLKTLQMDMPTFLSEEVEPVAKRRLERSLILEEIARVEEIEVDAEDERLETEFKQTLTELHLSGLDLRSIKARQDQQRLAGAVAMESASRLLARRTLERLKAIATGEAAGGGRRGEKASGKRGKSAAKAKRPVKKEKT